jgi:hypothetical protein
MVKLNRDVLSRIHPCRATNDGNLKSDRTAGAGKRLKHLTLSLSARTMQDGVGLAFFHFLKQLTRFQCGLCNDLDTAPFRLR